VVSVCDHGIPLPALCTNDTIFITVTPVNDPPVTFSEHITTPEDTPYSGNVLSNGDYDPDSTALTVNTTPVVPPAHGTFVIDINGNYTYTPDPGYHGNDMVVVAGL